MNPNLYFFHLIWRSYFLVAICQFFNFFASACFLSANTPPCIWNLITVPLTTRMHYHTLLFQEQYSFRENFSLFTPLLRACITKFLQAAVFARLGNIRYISSRKVKIKNTRNVWKHWNRTNIFLRVKSEFPFQVLL